MTKRQPVRWRSRLLRQIRGTAAVEMALVSPMLLILLTSIIDFSRLYLSEIKLSAAVAAAAQYTLINSANINSAHAVNLAATLSGIVANSNGTAWASTIVTVNGGSSSTVTNGTISSSGTAANADNCWCPTGGLASWTWGTAAACGSACAGGTLAGKFVTISGTRAFAAIFGHYGLITTTTLRQSVIVQAQ
jgi:Flp pilus assembly protein TadG